jgi:pimeloyl-ACP methyl ester carboxylesterase
MSRSDSLFIPVNFLSFSHLPICELDMAETPPNISMTRRTALATAVGAMLVSATSQTPAAVQAPVGGLILAPATDAIVPFKVSVPQSALSDLQERLRHTRLPEAETAPGWVQGVPLSSAKALLAYWREKYDWRKVERRLNALPQFRTRIDGLGIHFIHVRSRHANAVPMILTHGWPGSVLEFLDVIGPLTDPTAHGGRAEDAFHVVIPSLPGYGFSDKPESTGWGIQRIAKAWDTLMKRLGYSNYVAQGGDWGAGVTTWMGKQLPQGLLGIHLNLPILFPPPAPEGAGYGPEETAALQQLIRFGADEMGYSKLQGSRPQTLGYALADSPFGQAMWMYEKFHAWSEYRSERGEALTKDQMLDGINLYWLTNTATSSARLYAESFGTDFSRQELSLPVAVTLFKGDMFTPPKVWGERTYSKLVYWNEVDRGGHFAAWEQPTMFTEELRKAFAWVRRGT